MCMPFEMRPAPRTPMLITSDVDFMEVPCSASEVTLFVSRLAHMGGLTFPPANRGLRLVAELLHAFSRTSTRQKSKAPHGACEDPQNVYASYLFLVSVEGAIAALWASRGPCQSKAFRQAHSLSRRRVSILIASDHESGPALHPTAQTSPFDVDEYHHRTCCQSLQISCPLVHRAGGLSRVESVRAGAAYMKLLRIP